MLFTRNIIVLGEPNSPTNLDISVDGETLVASWREPFSLEGEELSYVVFITNLATATSREVTVNVSRYVLDNPIGSRNCSEEYELTVFSRNDYSRSDTAISRRGHIPMGKFMHA